MKYRPMLGVLTVLLVVTIASVLTLAPTASDGRSEVATRSRSAQRQAIKQMPILERPSRPGHFYGNTVRRRNSRQSHRG